MAAAAAIAAAAVTAAATAATTAYSASQSGGGGSSPTPHQFKPPRTARGLQREVAATLGANLGATPPSFANYIQSGGTARFPLQVMMDPKAAQLMGLVSKQGQGVPMMSGQTTPELSLEQKLYLGSQLENPHNPLVRAFNINNRIGRILNRPETPKRLDRIDRLREKRDNLLAYNRTGEFK